MPGIPRNKSPINPTAPQPPTVALSGPSYLSDSGLKVPAAWTFGLDQEDYLHEPELSLSDDDEREHVHEDEEEEKPARTLYKFEGKSELRELSLAAGQDITVLKEDMSEGWSLVRHKETIGLFPRSYYTFTSSFSSPKAQKAVMSVGSSTPRNSVAGDLPPLEPQSTGSYVPNFRSSVLGGRSINRFSNFVTSGAEEWVLNGNAQDEIRSLQRADPRDVGMASALTEPFNQKATDRHYIDEGPSWESKVPAFRVLVHSPSKRSPSLGSPYTIYQVTSMFSVPRHNPGSPANIRITVERRFTHFVSLHTALLRRLPGIVLPPLPAKQYTGRFKEDFVEARRGDLHRYLSRLIRHPLARHAEVLTFFLSCDTEAEWRRVMPGHLSMPPVGPWFYARVFHPSFNMNVEDAQDAGERFARHVEANGKGIQLLRDVFGRIRLGRADEGSTQRLLSYAILSLITATPIGSHGAADLDGTERSRGLLNNQNAWCWKDDCEECLSLTKAMQRTAEHLQTIADLHDNNARSKQLSIHEMLKDVAHPESLYQPVLETHRQTIERCLDADEDIAARCETVLNTTLAEFETYHTQRIEDFRDLTIDHLDNEIEFHTQVLSRLKAARSLFSPEQYSALGKGGPRQPSMYERDLANPKITRPPLPQPTPHAYDVVHSRPVSAVLQEGVGLLMGSPATGRTSVLGRFW
ncbi:hypothetical protein SISNIDRAFT_433832 [Sistotremastrum niveocremeum HHB9708]|uniref:PX-domain-containing protein n=1 Tax=Sistotremastrum niveocremeum HHB9708 TaxID=1314777 RepID=A0A164N1H6_9AGAM|nr:hypothetical protein SISNIDRAFT_433832 [Sistotremastrum niveocremeum HHB9708]